MKDQIAAAQQGDPRALSALYRDNFPWLYRYVRGRVAGNAAAEDVCSEIFTKAFENIAKFRAKSSFKTWLFSISRNELANWHRKEQPLVPLETELPEKKTEKSSTDYSELNRILKQMKDRYREVLELRYISGLSIKETAEVLKLKPGAVKVLQHRAVKQAKQLAERNTK